jgi:hypothetical protein
LDVVARIRVEDANEGARDFYFAFNESSKR